MLWWALPRHVDAVAALVQFDRVTGLYAASVCVCCVLVTVLGALGNSWFYMCLGSTAHHGPQLGLMVKCRVQQDPPQFFHVQAGLTSTVIWHHHCTVLAAKILLYIGWQRARP